jgi:hypothetical protein
MRKHATRGPVWNGLNIHLKLRKPDKGMAHRNQTLHCHLTRQIARNGNSCNQYCHLCPHIDARSRSYFSWFFEPCMRQFYRIVK